MISILLVEDDTEKARLITEVIFRVSGVFEDNIARASSVVEAKKLLLSKRFDLMILDINLPPRIDRPIKVGSGADIIRYVSDDKNSCYAPTYVIGFTAFDEAFVFASEAFANPLWKLVKFSHTDDTWQAPLTGAIKYILDSKVPPYRTDGITYHTTLGVVVGLEDVELESVLAICEQYAPISVQHDPNRYFQASFKSDSKEIDLIIVAAPRMGLTTSAIVATKLIENFRPRYLAMTGICAGVREKTNIGDILVADPCWDWGSGKITTSLSGELEFLDAPYQWRLDAHLRSQSKELSSDAAWLKQIYAEWMEARPQHEPRVLIDPIASGASVLQRKLAMESIKKQHKNLIGVEMEIFAVLTAAALASKPQPTAIGIKSVCDFGDEDKKDGYQKFAAYTSARYLKEFALRFLEPLRTELLVE